MTLWATFTPSFLWIFAGASYMERLRSNRALSTALAAITAAMVGGIANLTPWFGIRVLFSDIIQVAGVDFPALSSVDPYALVLTAVAFAMLPVLHRGVPITLLVRAMVGAGLHLVI